MIEVAFSCDYYYYCHAECSGQGLKVTCGLGTRGCVGGAGRASPSLGMLLWSQLLAPGLWLWMRGHPLQYCGGDAAVCLSPLAAQIFWIISILVHYRKLD